MLLSYIKHTNVVGAVETLSRIRSFALSVGWTGLDWEENKSWQEDPGSPGTYDFFANPNYGYLRLRTEGYGGGYYLNFGFYILNYYDGGTKHIMVAPNNGESLNYSSSTNPFRQLYWGHDIDPSPGWAIGADTYDELYIFGDSKWICCVANMDGVFCQIMHFGQMETFDSSPTNGACYGLQSQWKYTDNSDWTVHSAQTGSLYGAFWPNFIPADGSPSTDYPSCNFFWSDDPAYPEGEDNYWSYRIGYNYFTSSTDYFPLNSYSTGGRQGYMNFPMHSLLNANAWSDRRPLMKMLYFFTSHVNGQIVPLYRTPCFFCEWSGLSIGQTLEYGSEEYMFFPVGRSNWKIGIAFRVA
jgi:hypothetical protein